MARNAAALALAIACLAATAWAQPLDVTPRPLSAEALAGAPVAIASGAAVSTPAGDAGALAAADYLRDMTFRSRGLALRRAPGAARGAAIVFTRDGAADLGPEGYALTAKDGQARVVARTDAGLFYGAVTLWRLTTADGRRGAATLGPLEIVDRPRFAWRGLLLDSARHYQSPAFIEQLIDRMARDKLNVLQWHLTDDQAWRIEIRRYPRLTGVGAWRAAIDPASGRPTRYGGFYSQAEIRRIVAYAAARHVTIVPEIEMPGHSLSAILAYPALGVAPADARTQGDWGVFPSILDPSQRTIGFMDDVLTEVMALFPGAWINVGGDEAVKDAWRASPQVQAEIKRLGLADEEALQGWFTGQIGRFLAAHGRRLIGWDDIMKGGAQLPADAAVVSWHQAGAAQALETGHDAVIATDPTFYFDHRQSDGVAEPPGRGAVVSLADVYGYEPAPQSLPPAQRAHIIGVQANLWTEHMPTEQDVALMAFPRADALAEVAWTQPERKDWADFAARQLAERARDAALGLAADAAPPDGKGLTRPTDGVSRLVSQQLNLCTQKVALNLAAPRASQGGPYLVDIMNPCWIYPAADLGPGRQIRVDVTRLPFNFQLGADAAKIALAPPTTPDGELEVRADGCTGTPIAVLPLAPAVGRDGVTALDAALPSMPGRHDLCLTFTQRRLDPMWVVGAVKLEPTR
jgi:hexosaminidase